MNLIAGLRTHNDTARLPSRRCGYLRAWSEQKEVDQRKKAACNAAGDQGVIDAEVFRRLK